MNLYKDEDVLVTHDILKKEGYSSAFCKCGSTLHIKTPFFAQLCFIECPKCKHITQLYCAGVNKYIDEEILID